MTDVLVVQFVVCCGRAGERRFPALIKVSEVPDDLQNADHRVLDLLLSGKSGTRCLHERRTGPRVDRFPVQSPETEGIDAVEGCRGQT